MFVGTVPNKNIGESVGSLKKIFCDFRTCGGEGPKWRMGGEPWGRSLDEARGPNMTFLRPERFPHTHDTTRLSGPYPRKGSVFVQAPIPGGRALATTARGGPGAGALVGWLRSVLPGGGCGYSPFGERQGAAGVQVGYGPSPLLFVAGGGVAGCAWEGDREYHAVPW